MIKKKNTYLKEIEKYINFLNDLSIEELNDLESGKTFISHTLTSNAKLKSKNKSNILDLQHVINVLNDSQSREIAEQYLDNQNFKRADFESICKELDIPFNKKDNVEKLRDKIIEGTIGFRLRSQAIQHK